MKNKYIQNMGLGLTMVIFTACGGGSEDDTIIPVVSTTQPIATADRTIPVTVPEDVNLTTISTKEVLGELLFHDTSLSLDRTMSCATCHNPEHAFIDTRDNGVNAAVSLGDDGVSLGDRNTPMASYASFTPIFNLADLIGGQFLDGRASDLTEQAKGPFLNSLEMQMPDESSVIERVRENLEYISAMESIYGTNIFDDTDTAYTAIADAIAAFEKTETFSPFDSDLDTNTMSAAARRGQQLFRSSNCVRCHDDRGNNSLFSNFEYENLGIPANTLVRALNGQTTDHGLLNNPDVSDNNQDGKFKTSGLRNIAVTGPYMHNGVFRTLKTVVHFYNTRDVVGAINPETNAAWEDPEVDNRNIVRRDVGNLGLSDAQEDDIVSFLEALTDAKYKSLIP